MQSVPEEKEGGASQKGHGLSRFLKGWSPKESWRDILGRGCSEWKGAEGCWGAMGSAEAEGSKSDSGDTSSHTLHVDSIQQTMETPTTGNVCWDKSTSQ